MSRFHLGLGRQRLVLQAHFQRQMFTKLSTVIMLNVGLYSTACRHVKTETCVNAVSSVIIGILPQFLTDFKDKRGRGRMTHITMLTHPGKFREIQRPLF